MDITNLDDHRKIWKTNAAACAACGHSWQAVYPVGAEDVGLECPSCGSGLGSVLPNEYISKLSPNEDFDSTLHWPTEAGERVMDILKRLQIDFWREGDPDLKEAADEIERLRIDLEVAEDRKAKAQLFHNDMLKEIERLREDKAELLEALTDLYEACRWEKVAPEIDTAKAAIAKATGEE